MNANKRTTKGGDERLVGITVRSPLPLPLKNLGNVAHSSIWGFKHVRNSSAFKEIGMMNI